MQFSSPAGLSDRIRDYVERAWIRPARESARSQVTIRAGDIHSKMGLRDRMPAVCSALASKKLQQHSGVELLCQTGPRQGANAYFEYAIAGAPKEAESEAPPTLEEAGVPVAPPSRSAIGDGKTVVLVSCVAGKRAIPAPASDLYTSDWFLKARRYAESTGWPWFILSAEHGLVSPSDVIAPYEKTLNTMGVAERRTWSERAARQLRFALPEAKRFVFLAGARYREFLTEDLRKRGMTVEIPMEGLRIGEQLSWLNAHARPSRG